MAKVVLKNGSRSALCSAAEGDDGAEAGGDSASASGGGARRLGMLGGSNECPKAWWEELLIAWLSFCSGFEADFERVKEA